MSIERTPRPWVLCDERYRCVIAMLDKHGYKHFPMRGALVVTRGGECIAHVADFRDIYKGSPLAGRYDYVTVCAYKNVDEAYRVACLIHDNTDVQRVVFES